MPNDLPAHLTDLTFNGVDVQRADLSIHLDVVSGINDGLEVRGVDTVIPSLDGQTPRDRRRSVRHLVLAGYLQGTGVSESARQASYQALCDELEATFPLDDAPAILEGTARDGSTRSIPARTTNLVWDDEEVFGLGHVTVLLDSVDPDWTIA